MSLATDIQSDYTKIDDTEIVTLTPKYRTLAADATVTALRQPLNKKELDWASNAGLSPKAITFTLFNATLTPTPQVNDTITDSSSVVYTIMKVDKLTLGTRWRCVCDQE